MPRKTHRVKFLYDRLLENKKQKLKRSTGDITVYEHFFLLFKFRTSETKASFVSRTNALLVGTLISIGDDSMSIAIVLAKQTTRRIRILC